MKKVFLLICTVLVSGLLSTTASAQGINWETGTFQEALNKAKKNKKGPKLVFMDCYTTWCGPCKHMAKVIFPMKEAGDYFNANFVNIKMDMEKEEGVELNKQLKINAYPTFIIFDENGNEIGRFIGGGDIQTFIQRVELAKDITNSADYLYKKFEETKNSEIAYKYLSAARNGLMREKIIDFYNNHFDDLGNRKYSLRTWFFAENAISLLNPSFLIRVMDEKLEFDAEAGKGVVDNTLCKVLVDELYYIYLNKYKEIPSELIERVCTMLTFIGEPDAYSSIIISAAKAMAKNDNVKLKEIVGQKYLGYSLTAIQYKNLCDIFEKIEGVTEEEIAAYKKGYQEFYQNAGER